MRYIFSRDSVNVPELFKRRHLKNISRFYKFSQAVETGTYFGQTTKILSKNIPEVFSIEISQNLNNYLVRKFQFTNVNILFGDSAEVLHKLISKLHGSTLFYLDGHANGGITERGQFVTPLKKELALLADFNYLDKSVIIVDDIISINGQNDYPKIEVIHIFAKKKNLDMMIWNNMMLLKGNHLIKKNQKKSFRLLQNIFWVSKSKKV